MKKKLLVSAIVNIITFVIVTVTFFIAFFRPLVPDVDLITNGMGLFKFFTVQSNVLYAVVALVYGIMQILVFAGRRDKIPTALVVLKHVATVGVALTFLTVALYLAPINSKGYFELFKSSNFFFHFLVPVTAMVMLLFVDGEKTEFKCTFFGLAHFTLYGIGYILNGLAHMENGSVRYPTYDWYYIMQNGALVTVIMVVIMCAMTYAISLLLWLGANKIRRGDNQ